MNQLRQLLTLLLLMSYTIMIDAQDTFSIVAVDTVTGEIGSAGASCVGPYNGVGAFIISDVIEGIGAVHTQSYWNAVNKQNAHNKMLEGLSPQEIIDWLIANDAENNPSIRQYGIVDLTRKGESAGFTGANCLNYKNHLTGACYSVQGNILLGAVITDTMEYTFLNTAGPLADRLMAVLQSAKIIGADTRCAPRNTSSQSGFIKVVRVGDGNKPYLQIIVPDTPIGKDPIDSVQVLFNGWKDSLSTIVDPFLSTIIVEPDTIPANGTSQAVITIIPKNNSDTLMAGGKLIVLSNTGAGTIGTVKDNGDGTYEAAITAPLVPGIDTISAFIITPIDTVSIFIKGIVFYENAVSVNEKNLHAGKYYLYQNYPQPFNSSTIIKYQIPERAFVTIKIYDVLGNEIGVLVNEEKQAGEYEFRFNGTDLTSGVYFYIIQAGMYSQTRKMILLN